MYLRRNEVEGLHRLEMSLWGVHRLEMSFVWRWGLTMYLCIDQK
jgi:hypothetical protein